MLTGVLVETADVVAVKPALVAPAGTMRLAGTDTVAGLLLASETRAPPEGAAAVRVTVPADDVPPVTEVGFTLMALNAAGAAVPRCAAQPPSPGRSRARSSSTR